MASTLNSCKYNPILEKNENCAKIFFWKFEKEAQLLSKIIFIIKSNPSIVVFFGDPNDRFGKVERKSEGLRTLLNKYNQDNKQPWEGHYFGNCCVLYKNKNFEFKNNSISFNKKNINLVNLDTRIPGFLAMLDISNEAASDLNVYAEFDDPKTGISLKARQVEFKEAVENINNNQQNDFREIVNGREYSSSLSAFKGVFLDIVGYFFGNDAKKSVRIPFNQESESISGLPDYGSFEEVRNKTIRNANIDKHEIDDLHTTKVYKLIQNKGLPSEREEYVAIQQHRIGHEKINGKIVNIKPHWHVRKASLSSSFEIIVDANSHPPTSCDHYFYPWPEIVNSKKHLI